MGTGMMMNNESREATKTLSMRKKIGLHVKEEEKSVECLSENEEWEKAKAYG